MIRELMHHANDLFFICTGLLCFVLMFVTIILTTFRKGSKKTFKAIAALPLEKEELI